MEYPSCGCILCLVMFLSANPFLCKKNDCCMLLSERSMMFVKKEEES